MKPLFKYIAPLFFCLTISCFVHAQNPWADSVKNRIATSKPDSHRVNSLLALSDACRLSYPDSGLMYAQEALLLSKKLKDDTLMFWSLVCAAGCLYPLGNFSAELNYALEIQSLAKRLNTPFTRGYANGSMSDAYLNFGEYKTSIAHWRKVIEIAEYELPGERTAIYGNSALLFARARQYDSALIYAKKALDALYSNSTFNHDSAAIKFFSSNIFVALGEAFAGIRQYDSAVYYFRQSLHCAESMDMRFNKIDDCNGIAAVYKEQGKYDSAIFYLQKVFAVDGASKRYPIAALKAAGLIAALYETGRQPDSSLKYMHIASDIKDSVYSRDKTSAFQNIIYQQKEKENEVAIATEKLQNRYRLYFLIAAFISIVIIASIILRNRRVKQLQLIRNNIADDLHDDIGSALSSISILNELAKEKSPEALPLLTSIGESAAAIQENMSDIVWAVNPDNDHFENVLQRMQLFATEILDAKNIRLEFNSDTSLNNARLTMKQRKNLYLFFKETLNNAAKHSGAEKIVVDISKKEHSIEITIKDNGSGFNTSGIFNGNGMSSLKKRAKELNALYNINSRTSEGTTVQLKFKIT